MSTLRTPSSPRILAHAWGRMQVEGAGGGRDFKLWPGGARPWDWRETDTHHVPGIQPADVEELLAHGARVVVLSRGRWLRLRTRKVTLDLLSRRGVEARMAETGAAVALYNQLAAAGQAVGALIHSTC